MNKSLPQKPISKSTTVTNSSKVTSSIPTLMKMSNSSNPKSSSNNKDKKTPTEWRQRLSSQNYELLRETFLIFDQDGSGQIDPSQVSKVLQDLGLNKRNQYVVHIVTALRQKNKKLNFEQFVDVVASYTGEVRTRDGLIKLFNLYDQEQTGVIQFQQLKKISRHIGQNLTDQDILEMMHSVFINHKTTSNESISFQEFYTIISSYYNRKQVQKKFI